MLKLDGEMCKSLADRADSLAKRFDAFCAKKDANTDWYFNSGVSEREKRNAAAKAKAEAEAKAKEEAKKAPAKK